MSNKTYWKDSYWSVRIVFILRNEVEVTRSCRGGCKGMSVHRYRIQILNLRHEASHL